MILYKLRSDEVIDEENCKHTVYGVDIFEQIRSVPDIFTDDKNAKQFVSLCNELQLAPVHFNDAVENVLGI